MNEQHRSASIYRIATCFLIFLAGLALPTSKPTSAQPITFGDPAFARQWNYSDKAVSEHKVTRSWLWGPPLLPGRNERLIGSLARGTTTSADYHFVQYFDKARMEFNAKEGIVTNGRLVVEMMSGDIQMGLKSNEHFTIRPSKLAIAGDTAEGQVHPNTATYASLFKIATIGGAGMRASKANPGTKIAATYTRFGSIYTLPTNAVPGDKIPAVRTYFPENNPDGHNIPDVFMEFLTQSSLVWNANENRYSTAGLFENWVTAVGLPITEPYWTQVRIGGVDSWVMFQAFERRILTYNPSTADPTWRVEMGNVGQHYKDWRPEPLQKPTLGGALVVQSSLYTTRVCSSYKNDNFADDACQVQPLQDPQPSVTTLQPQSWARTYENGSMLLQTDNTIYEMQAATKLVFKRIDNSVDAVNQQYGWVDYIHQPKKRITVETDVGQVVAIDTRFSVIMTNTAQVEEAELRIVVPSKGGSVTLQLPSQGPNLPVPPPIIVQGPGTLTVIKGLRGLPKVQPISGSEEQYWNEKVNRLQNIPGLEEVTRLGEVSGPRIVLAYYQPSFTLDDWKSGNTSDVPAFPYDSSSSSALEGHVAQAWYLGVDGFISEWTGTGSKGDQNLGKLFEAASKLLSAGFISDFSPSRVYPDVKVGINFNMSLLPSQPDDSAAQVEKAISMYAGKPGYLSWGGKPVFFFRNAGSFGDLESWRKLRDRIDPKRVQLWVVDSIDMVWLEVFDALSLLDGSLKDDVSQMLTVNQGVRSAVDRYNIDNIAQRLWIAGVVPGRDTRNLKVGNQPNPNPRVLERNDVDTYNTSWGAAINSGADWIFINSFNDWYQGTHIERSKSYGNKYSAITTVWSRQYKTGIEAR
jgi:hypothetical protein